MRRIVYILILSIVSLSVYSQKESNDVRAGNKLYKEGKFTEAEIEYRKGLQKNPKSFEANYNLGNALFKQKKYSDALEQYENSIALQSNDKEKLAAAYHNTGNALLSDKKIEESIDAYKMALKNNPKDNDTRYNLAYAQMLLKQQQSKNKNKKDNDDTSDDAENIKKRAEKLVAERKYEEAYNLMKEGEKRNKKLLQYSDFTNRILDVVKMKIN